jgi:hypothetical protein
MDFPFEVVVVTAPHISVNDSLRQLMTHHKQNFDMASSNRCSP